MPPDQEPIAFRAIKNLSTGQIVTGLSPIFAGDYPYGGIAPNQAVLRYLDFYKFEDMLKTSTLYFRRADKLEELEGTISKQSVDGTSASDKAWAKTVTVERPDYEERLAYRKIAKQMTFINCWHINNVESRQMWDAYTSSPDSVVVISSCERLLASLTIAPLASKVMYVTEDTPRTEFDECSLFFYKDKEKFGFEREFRLLLDRMMIGDGADILTADGLALKPAIDLSSLIFGINHHPDATSATMEKVSNLLAQFLPECKMQS